jgi:hypothetical protein
MEMDEFISCLNELNKAGVTDREIANVAQVAPSTVARWRKGVAKPHPGIRWAIYESVVMEYTQDVDCDHCDGSGEDPNYGQSYDLDGVERPVAERHTEGGSCHKCQGLGYYMKRKDNASKNSKKA